MANIAESEVQSFGYDSDSGRTILLTRPTEPNSFRHIGPLLQIQDRAGAVQKEWRLSAEYGARLSHLGRYALIERWGKGSRSIEVVGIDGQSLWQSSLLDIESSLSVSDQGTVFQMPGPEGGEFAFFDRTGKRFPINEIEGPDEQLAAIWSPQGYGLMLASGTPPRLRCISHEGAIAYDFATNLLKPRTARSIRRIAVWDDCSSVAAVFDTPATAGGEFLRISPEGMILHRRALANERPGSAKSSLSLDQRAFAYISPTDGVHQIQVLDRDSLATLHTVALSPDESATEVIMGRTSDEFAVEINDEPPMRGPFVYTKMKGEAFARIKIRLYRNCKPWKEDFCITISNDFFLYFRPRFDEKTGAFLYNDGREIKRCEPSQ